MSRSWEDSSGHTLTVGQLSRLVGGALRHLPARVVVRGELVNITKGRAGHMFAALRGDGMALRCFVHARVASSLGVVPCEGDTVTVEAGVCWYRTRGDAQLLISSLAVVDEQTRHLERIARTQVRLEAAGVLRANRRLQLPSAPLCIAVVGASQSAGVLDLVTALHRRAPWVAIQLHATKLQGAGAENAIAEAIRTAGASDAAAIAVVRGGGSREDFLPFDSEEVCYAIARSPLPVVTALGHEQDRRLADLAAHTSASTPSVLSHKNMA